MDTTPPVITLNGSSTISIALNGTYKEKGATATDKGQSVKVTFISDVNEAIIGTYKVVYTAVDKVGNKATKVRTVKVVSDFTPPDISITTPTSIKEGESFSATATAKDNGVNIAVTMGGYNVTDATRPGTYTITYRAEDDAGNVTTKDKNVTVEALTIAELLTASSNGRDGVTYVAVGDSTRNYPGVNTSFVSDYYPNQLDNIGIDFKNSAASGQRAYEWLAGNSYKDWYAYSETIDMIPTDYEEQRNYILEFSMGINDAKEKNRSEFTTILRDSIQRLQRDRKYIKILLVSPVPHALRGSQTTSVELEEIYKKISRELHLPFVSGKDILEAKYNSERDKYYVDSVHPNALGSKILFNHIFQTIATPTIYNLVKRQ
jgi:lysophospholipase L1-like esterase